VHFRRNAFKSIVCCAVLVAVPRAHALEIEEASIADIEAAYHDGELTAQQLVAAYLARINDKQGPYINSIINLNPKALEEADKLDAVLKATGKPVGPMHGIPVLIKNCIDAEGMPMTAGFQGHDQVHRRASRHSFQPVSAPRVRSSSADFLYAAAIVTMRNGINP
jgi:amidase